MDIIIASATAAGAWLRVWWPWLVGGAIALALLGALVWLLWWRLPKQQAERLRSALVRNSGGGHRAVRWTRLQAMRCDSGIPSRVIRLSTEQPTRASVFWLGRVRARRPRPMMVLYRNTAVSPSERLP